MPHVYNGCGTWYYGRKNVNQYSGTCRACNRQAILKSYDTRLYVVIIFVPVIPLQSKRIVEECSACRRHFVIPLADWNRASRRAQDTLIAYRASPADADLAREALRASVGLRNLPIFLELAPEVEQGMASNAQVLCMLAGAHEIFARIHDSERILRLALELKPDDDDVREAYAGCLMTQGKPEDAEPYLRHIIDKGVPDRIDPLYRLAQGYQLKGRHEKAIEIFDQCERVNPHIINDATFARLKQASEKNLGKQTVVQPSEIVRKAKARDARRKFLKLAPMVIGILIIAYLAICALMGMQTSVFLVNGVGKPYTVVLNGASYPLAPHEVKKIRIPQGDIRVQIPNLLTAPSQTVPIRTPFFNRLFASHTFVINPDRSALLVRRHIIYVPQGTGENGRGPDEDYFTGRMMHQFDGIDYEFKPPPREIQLDSHSSETRKESLSTFAEDNISAPILLASSQKTIGDNAVRDSAEAHLLIEPDQTDYLLPLSRALSPDDFATFLHTGLDARPARIQWHRAYQQAMETAGKADQCAAEYTAMLAADPDNKDLLYLMSRQTHDADKALSLLNRAVSGDAPSSYAFYSLCGYYVDSGDYHRAAEYARLAIDKLPHENEVRYYAQIAFVGDGQYDEAAAINHADEAGKLPNCLEAYVNDVVARAAQGRVDLAQEVINQLLARFSRSSSFANEQASILRAHLAYCTGDPNGFVSHLRNTSERFAATITDGDIQEADHALDVQPNADATEHALLYLAASKSGSMIIASHHLDAAISLLSKGDYDDRVYAAALSGKPIIPTADLVRVRDNVNRKVILLTAIGASDPSSREACFAAARKLVYTHDFPYLILHSVLGYESH